MNHNSMAQPRQNAPLYSANPTQYGYYDQIHAQQLQQNMRGAQATLQPQQQGQPHTIATAGNHFPPQSFSQPRFAPSSPAQSSSPSQAPIRFSQAFGPVQLQQLVSRDGRQRFLVFLPITAAGNQRLIQMAAAQGVEPTTFVSNNLRFFQGASDRSTGRPFEQNAAGHPPQQQPQSLSGHDALRSHLGHTDAYGTVPAGHGHAATSARFQHLAPYQHHPTQQATGTPRWNVVAIPQPASTPNSSNGHPATPASPGLVPDSVDIGTKPSPAAPLEKVNIDLTTGDDETPCPHPATPVRRPVVAKAIPGSMRWQAQNAARKLSQGPGKNAYAPSSSEQTEEQKAREAAKAAAVAAYEKVKADSQKRAQRSDSEQGPEQPSTAQKTSPSDNSHAQTLSASIIAEAALPTPRNDSVSSGSQGSQIQECQLGSALNPSAQHDAGSIDVLPDEVRKMQGGESVKQTFHGLDKAGFALNLPWLPGTVTCVRKLQRDGRVEICLTGDLDVAQVRMDKLMGLPKEKRAAPSAVDGVIADGEPSLGKQTDGEIMASKSGMGRKYRQKKPQSHWSNLTDEQISSRANEQEALIGERSVVRDEGTWDGADHAADGDLEQQLTAAFASEDPSPGGAAAVPGSDLLLEVAAPSTGTTAPQNGAQLADESSPNGFPQSAELFSPQGETSSGNPFTSSPEAIASVAEQNSGARGDAAAGGSPNGNGLVTGDGTDHWHTMNTQGEAARSSSVPIDFETPLAEDDDDLFGDNLFGESDSTSNSTISAVVGPNGTPILADESSGRDKRKRSVGDVGESTEPPHKKNSVRRFLVLPSMGASNVGGML
ncbi:hypothetical protein KC318_g4094 [Hortaea werneckii]|nr:hypothetical protein KC334_g4138 [Hortaea werneckii]KAI7016637.1 hypothetical protein KC355_g3918 [Hortaea werneckii]KAI7193798.1 hypothetical protein KC324_g5079 [Hortaea werneckii]KAI7587804.1 hypothetical protein KC316_g4831 [Hortaea werneckii]KAI7670344.1 hypothetical protein KC318_g4094 [Hortaea werneckii]